MGAVEGVVFVRQGIDQEIFPESERTEFFNEGQAVENMTTIQQQRHDGYCCQGNTAGKETYHQILQGTGQDKQTAGACPDKIIARTLHQYAIGQTYGDEADENGKAVLDRIAKGFCHNDRSFL